jgi:hypothetical protein
MHSCWSKIQLQYIKIEINVASDLSIMKHMHTYSHKNKNSASSIYTTMGLQY